ncbi:MAG TPA: carboxypeptidase-like regulatory domain-containing protein [Terracidiphilus sp.]|nr:carboxypeptidase-like regulatory domain-containing protein [Terracidiphilus sp.]
MSGILALAAFFVFNHAVSPALHAQAGTTASLSGTIVDVSGAVIPNAVVTLRNSTNGAVSEVTSNGVGDFVFAAVAVGDYSLEVRARGFSVLKESGIHLDPGSEGNLHELRLATGSDTQIVEVHSTAESISMDSGELSSVISANDISRIPVEGRDVTELIKTLPGFGINGAAAGNGVTNVAFDPSQVSLNDSPYGAYSGMGTPLAGVAVLYDGIDLTHPGAYNSTMQNINFDQVSEVKITTSSMTADQAHGPIVISAAGIPGSIDFHGGAYVNGRTYQMNSVDWLTKNTHQLAPVDREIYPGFKFTGPLIIPGTKFNSARRLTFFVGGEEMAQRGTYAYGSSSEAILTDLVPTINMHTGNFSQNEINSYLGPLINNPTYATSPYAEVPKTGTDDSLLTNGQLNPGQIDPVAQAIFNLMPYPNTPTTAGGYNYIHTNLENNDLWQGQVRSDYNVNDSNKIFALWSTEHTAAGVPQWQFWSPGGLNTPGGGMLQKQSAHMGTVNWISIISPTMTNELQVGLSWFNGDFVDNDPSALTLDGKWTNPGLFNNGSKEIPALLTWTNWGIPMLPVEDTTEGGIFMRERAWVFEDNFTKVLGHHSFRFGFHGQQTADHEAIGWIYTNGGITAYYEGLTYFRPNGQQVWNTNAPLGWGSNWDGGNYLANFMEGTIGDFYQYNMDPKPYLYFWDFAGYAQDHWRATPYLTFDYGVRIDHINPWADSHDIGIPVWDAATYNVDAKSAQNPLLPGYLWHGMDSSIPSSGVPARWAFVEPRVGFALDVFHNSKTVVRGGFGIYAYHDNAGSVQSAAGTAEGMREFDPGGTGGIQLSDVSSNSPPAASFIPYNDSYGLLKGDNHQPQTYTYNLAVDEKVFKNATLQAAYIGNVSRHLPNNGTTGNQGLDNLNAIPVGKMFGPDPITGQTYPWFPEVDAASPTTIIPTLNGGMTQQQMDDFRQYPTYNTVGILQHNVNSNYNGLQMVFNKQLGVSSFGLNYTFSKALGVRGSIWNGTAVDPTNYRNNYGVEPFDHSQIFNATYAYGDLLNFVTFNKITGRAQGLVKNWMISGITGYQQGADLGSQLVNYGLSGRLNVFDPSTNASALIGPGNIAELGTPDVHLMPVVTCKPNSGLHTHQYVNTACFSLASAPTVGSNGNVTGGAANGSYSFPYTHGPGYFNSDLALQKQVNLGGDGKRNLQLRFSAFNVLNYANRTFTQSIDPNALILNFENGGAATPQSVSTAFSNATNTNANFGFAPNRTGRRVTEAMIKYNF